MDVKPCRPLCGSCSALAGAVQESVQPCFSHAPADAGDAQTLMPGANFAAGCRAPLRHGLAEPLHEGRIPDIVGCGFSKLHRLPIRGSHVTFERATRLGHSRRGVGHGLERDNAKGRVQDTNLVCVIHGICASSSWRSRVGKVAATSWLCTASRSAVNIMN